MIKKNMLLKFLLFFLIFTSSSLAMAQAKHPLSDVEKNQNYKHEKDKLVLGVRLGGGFSFYDKRHSSETQYAKFSGAFATYINYNFSTTVELQTGLGAESQGRIFSVINSNTKHRILYMAIPVLVKFNISNFHTGFGISLLFALSGKTWFELLEEKRTFSWSDDDWNNFRRINLGANVFAGYKIPLGAINIVPSISCSYRILKDIKFDHQDFGGRFSNVLFNFAVEAGVF